MTLLFDFKKVALTLTMGAALTGCYSDKTVSVLVQTSTGASIPNAEIVVNNQSYKTDANGVASFNVQVPNTTKQVVVNFKKEGFVNQSILYDVPTAKKVNIAARLLPIKQTITVDNIELAQTIESNELHAKIDIPASAFVLPNGKAATGKISVDFTPWNITSNDLNAMPANGVAKNKKNKIVNLISAGMISATFKNASGQELQLARNKSADIQMDLPLKSINNQEMKAGVSIPMWHFDEANGLWVEEGTGHVIESEKSSTGLVVQAKVSHFSTWNWDYEFTNSGSVFVQCQTKGVGIPCNVVAKATLEDGSGFSKSTSLPAEGSTIIYMPSKGSIHWTAKDVTGTMIGENISGTTGNVIIDLGTPTTDNTVKCTLADGTAVACSGKLNNDVDFSVSKEGGNIKTGIEASSLTWVASSNWMKEGDQWVKYTGTLISSVNGNINIILDQKESSSENSFKFFVQCTSINDSSLAGKPCPIYIRTSFKDIDNNSNFKLLKINSFVGQKEFVILPDNLSGFSSLGEGTIESVVIFGGTNTPNSCGVFEVEAYSNKVDTLEFKISLDSKATLFVDEVGGYGYCVLSQQ